MTLFRWTASAALAAIATFASANDPLGKGPEGTEMAVFAGGCFWCTEADFDKVPGVVDTVSGYIGGEATTATYEQVSAGGTEHIEAVAVFYDPDETSYDTLVEAFWPTIDPLTPNAQFCDRGRQYRSALFYANEAQQRTLQASVSALGSSGQFDQPIVTELLPRTAFFPAEDYHQDYYQKNPIRYNFYRSRCGRDARLAELWGEDR
ncbi:peptide-methionine (S)-S-oxide reductase [Halopseudomonas xinjiangensis]|uniref:Peptide methionine sulfoxide reductase MsrA n=1 Tax=Halopseudomonas xinjiangensis TaxID=487184 RepID=A0A1H1TK92_9GAMM|nr:peptide-methionine (S)-S-oxide reductase MsrA [Halopseudomonas xinjiangensis]SDS60612.1 peptide-methionine (S)-S-oxide reductase [Halopseudomonas xinjiangensis]